MESCKQVACFLCVCSSKAPCRQASPEWFLTKGLFCWCPFLFPSSPVSGAGTPRPAPLRCARTREKPFSSPGRPSEVSAEETGRQSQGGGEERSLRLAVSRGVSVWRGWCPCFAFFCSCPLRQAGDTRILREDFSHTFLPRLSSCFPLFQEALLKLRLTSSSSSLIFPKRLTRFLLRSSSIGAPLPKPPRVSHQCGCACLARLSFRFFCSLGFVRITYTRHTSYTTANKNKQNMIF